MVLRKLERLEDYTPLISSKEPPTVVEFFATWCPHCRRIEPFIAELASKYDDLTILQVDVDEFQELAERAGVAGTPTFISYVDGKEIGRLSGGDSGSIEKMVREVRASPAEVAQ